MKDTYKNLMQRMTENPVDTLNMTGEIKDELRKRKCIFEGETFKLALVPIILKKKELDLIASVAEMFYSLINKIIKESLHNKKMEEYFSYKDVPEEWISVDGGYINHAVITRLDALYDGKTLKFLEFNTDNPGGKGWTDVIEEIILSHPVYKELFPSGCDHHKKSVVNGIFEATIKSSSDFWGEHSIPSVAIIDYRDSQFLGDAEIVRDYFLSKNIHAKVLDPRDLIYNGKNLTNEGIIYNTVIRCVKANEFLDYPEELKGYISAYLNGHVCMINSFKALLGSEKSLLALLCNMNFHHHFTDEEKKAIKNYIPWTFRLSDKKGFSRDGEEIEMQEYLIKNQENYVIKPSWGYGGKGVVLGKHVSGEEWKETVYKYAGDCGWIAQEYVNVPKIELPVINGDKVEMSSKYFNLNPYVFGGKYVGCLGRISELPVINVSAGGGIIPVCQSRDFGD